jgi:hypothetical protein
VAVVAVSAPVVEVEAVPVAIEQTLLAKLLAVALSLRHQFC